MMQAGLQTPLPIGPPHTAEINSVHETAFFRDSVTFGAIRDTILPELIQRNAGQRCLRIWSAGCSTGQEPYALAMLLAEDFPQLARWKVQILGSDVSPAVVGYATAGRYKRVEVNRGLPARLLLKYFDRQGDEWQIAPHLREMCRFACLDLSANTVPLPRFDLVLLRNVLLYLPGRVRTRIFRNIHSQLRPGGFLVLGASEQAEDATDLFTPDFAPEFYFYRPIQRLSSMG